MKLTLLLTLGLIPLSPGAAHAQDEPPDRAAPRSLRSRPRVDFWDAERKKPSDAKRTFTPETLWTEPMVGADGKVSLYVPPKPVLAFLQEPTRENARQYVAWQSERMKRIKAAVEMLRTLQSETRAVESAEEPPTAAANVSSPDVAVEILYFAKPGCPWCRRQEVAFTELRERLPKFVVTSVPPDDARWKSFEVKVAPTLVITTQGNQRVVRGYTSANDLARVIGETRHEKR